MNTIQNVVCTRTALTSRSSRALARALTILPLLGAFLAPSAAHASGLGNLTYTAQEVMKPVSNFGGTGAFKWPTGPTGANTAIILHQKLVVMGSLDSGKPPGSLHIYDVSDPRKPILQKTLDGTPETSKLRELHAMPVAMIDGKTIMVLPTTTGLQFFDFTDPLDPKPAGTFALAGANGGDYDNTLWMLSYQWPYVFAGGTGNGIYVVDATDPANCSLVTRIATGTIGNFRIGPTFAAGNYVVGVNMDQVAGTQVAVIDVGNPKAPFLAATGKTPASLYSSLIVGDHLYGAGTNGDYVMMKWSGTAVSVLATGKSGSDRGGYCTYQSPFAFCGQSSEGFKKWNTTGDKLMLAGIGTDPNGAGGDFDFSTVMGNLVFLGNDHGTGSALIPHQMGPDNVAPTVVKIYPSEAKQPLTSRVTVFFSEDVDLDTVSPTSIVVRTAAGAVVPGVFSKSSFNAVSFGAKQPLAANTTYEVSIPAGGLSDLVGNKLTEPASVRFSTGPTIDVGSPTGGTGGGTSSGGASSGGGTATGGAPAMAGMGGTQAMAGSASVAGAPAAGSGGSGPAEGGASGISGAPPSNGGTTSAAGSVAAAGAATTPPSPTTPADPNGCSCSMPGGTAPAGFWLLGMGAACVGLGRLRTRSRRSGAKQA